MIKLYKFRLKKNYIDIQIFCYMQLNNNPTPPPPLSKSEYLKSNNFRMKRLFIFPREIQKKHTMNRHRLSIPIIPSLCLAISEKQGYPCFPSRVSFDRPGINTSSSKRRETRIGRRRHERMKQR